MTRFLFPEITVREQYRGERLHKRPLDCAGVDTETFNGTCKLICDSFGRALEPSSIEEVLEFLSYKELRGKNFFFNVSYDFDGIIKLFPEETIREIYSTKSVEYSGYKVSYLDGKFFKVSKGKHSNAFYDLNNFLETSLNKAAQTHLRLSKLPDIDGHKLNTSLEYWKENHEKIIAYCKRDAWLTKRLAEWYFDLIEKTLDFKPIRPYSKGALSQEYFMKNCIIPTVNRLPLEVLEYAYYAYAGGRFELLQRGYFPRVSIFDIKSAYPSILANLPDFNYGHFYYTDSIPDSVNYGWFLCDILAYHRHLSPFLKKHHNLNLYPNGHYIVYMNLSEIQFIQKYFPKTEIEIIDGFYWEPYKLVYPLKEEIKKLYSLKERTGDRDTKDLYKTMLNAYYGKTIQVNPDGGTGQAFNPLWASECTAQTRIKLLKFALQAGVENIIGFSTDAIHLSRWYNYDISKELGKWDRDIQGEGLYLYSDIYSVWNKDKTKDVFRGMIQDEGRFMKIRELLERMGKKTRYKYMTYRPLHLGEAIMQKDRKISEVNTWQEIPKTFDVNGDRKRIWDREFTSAQECTEENHSSEPVLLNI